MAGNGCWVTEGAVESFVGGGGGGRGWFFTEDEGGGGRGGEIKEFDVVCLLKVCLISVGST